MMDQMNSVFHVIILAKHAVDLVETLARHVIQELTEIIYLPHQMEVVLVQLVFMTNY